MAHGSYGDLEGMDREKSKSVGALRALAPFISPYKGIAFFAGIALVLTATISLALPLAVRQVVDSFGADESAVVDVTIASLPIATFDAPVV